MDTENQIHKLEQDIIIYRSKLTSDTSEIGDWKIIKIYEARLLEEKDPYDINELTTKRQEIRNKINDLQKEIETLKNN